jgi:hypothetical protein
MWPMKKMRLQLASQKLKNLATIDVGAGAFSRDVTGEVLFGLRSAN